MQYGRNAISAKHIEITKRYARLANGNASIRRRGKSAPRFYFEAQNARFS